MIKRLFSCVGEYKTKSILAPITVGVEVVLEVIIPLIMAKIIDVGIANKDLPYVFKLGGIMIALALGGMVMGVASGYFASVAATGFAKNLRHKLFSRLEGFSFANIDKYSTASLITRLTTDITNVEMSYLMIIRTMMRAPLMLICATIMAFRIDSELALVFLVAVPFLAVFLVVIGVKAKPRFEKMLKKYDELTAHVQEDLTAIRVVKSFVRADYEVKGFKKISLDTNRIQITAERLIVLAMPLMQLVMYACMIAIVWFGGNKIYTGRMGAGELMGFISYIAQILISLMMICFVLVMVVLSRASLNRIDEILKEQIDITDDGADETLTVKNGDISYKNVGFSYGKDVNKEVLQDINLDIKSGEVIGIIGGTGSAKTTLVQLIPRLYDITEGELTIAGRSVKDYKLRTLRDSVAMVLQKNVLFSGTIKDNLKWGDENATDEEIFSACRAAQAHDFITSFPDGYDTVLGQGGVNVSGGQKQRLCIARALLKKPKIMILDDSTSAVDTATDARIRESFRTHFSDVTVIIIAQRVNSVSDADKIIVMNNGRIDDMGTHTELVARNEIYRDVCQSQGVNTEVNNG